MTNPVRTVSDTIDAFYKDFSEAPVLPMYRSFLIDFLTTQHLGIVDIRFKYDAVYALGLRRYFDGLMGSYDKLVGGPMTEKIWVSLVKSLGMDPAKVREDAEAVEAYAGATSPSNMLGHMEGKDAPAVIAEAFSSIKSKLFTSSYSIGLFRMMELCKVEVNAANAEEWAKALGITPATKVTADLETYRQNQLKVQRGEEMIREIEIREKKKLAEKLEQKAKALAAKASAKADE